VENEMWSDVWANVSSKNTQGKKKASKMETLLLLLLMINNL
jgi:hypothetical protein